MKYDLNADDDDDDDEEAELFKRKHLQDVDVRAAAADTAP